MTLLSRLDDALVTFRTTVVGSGRIFVTAPPRTTAALIARRAPLATLGLVLAFGSAIGSIAAALPFSIFRTFVYLTIGFFFIVHLLPNESEDGDALVRESPRNRTELFFSALTIAIGFAGLWIPIAPAIRIYRGLLGIAFGILLALPFRIPIRSGWAARIVRVLVPVTSLVLTFFVDVPLLAGITEAPIASYFARVDRSDIIPEPGASIARVLNLGIPTPGGTQLSPTIHDAIHALNDNPIAGVESVAPHLIALALHREDLCPSALIVEQNAPPHGYLTTTITERMASCALAAHSPREAGAVYRYLQSAPPASFAPGPAAACRIASPLVWAIIANAATVSARDDDPNAALLAQTLFEAAGVANRAPLDIAGPPSLNMLVPCFTRARQAHHVTYTPNRTSTPAEKR